ncbi:MAG TPA: choice-of-anchor B family protein, partial [Calditrichia bacterium]|nr:choice-of-anchor B family protein [Calditrichia bacterium]
MPLLSHLNQYPTTGYSDVWGYVAPDGTEYALLGVRNGMSIVDISDAENDNIFEVAFIPSPNSIWKDYKTYGHYAYAVTEASTTMQIIDLSDLPNSAPVVATYTGFTSGPHNIWIDVEAGILYGAEDNNFGSAVRVISLADPLNPVELTNFAPDCHDMFAQDGLLLVAQGTQPSIGIYDVSNPASPTLINELTIPAAGYVHNVWPTADNLYMMTTEETTGKTIKYWDISDPTNPSLLSEVLAPDGLAHNAHIKGDYSYVSHYSDGLRIYDVSDPANVFETGYYDTADDWGAYPYFASGKVLISDISDGLYVVYFQGALDADPLDPNAVTGLSAYSDYQSPGEIALNWTDPTTYVNGDPLPSSDFTVEISRDGTPVASVSGGTGTYTDGGLSDGQSYTYSLLVKDVNDSLSQAVETSWTAGGAVTPAAPMSLVITDPGSGDLVANWTNPSVNVDGTPMDDFAAIRLYENGSLIATFTRTSSDTGSSDSNAFTPASGTNQYYVTAVDNESPANESAASNLSYSPLALPFFDDFPTAGDPNPSFWINGNAAVTGSGVNPPSAPNALTLNGDPNGGDQVDLLPVDLSNEAGNGLVLVYWYQPAGTGNDPETGDSLRVDLLNDQGRWVRVRAYPGTPQVPFVQVTVALDNENAGSGATFFHPGFQVRFSSLGTSGGDFDLWLIDDVFLGAPSASPEMSVSASSISETLLHGAQGSAEFTISNLNGRPSTLTFTIAEDPAADWISVTPQSGAVASLESTTITVDLDAGAVSPGTYSTNLIISGNDPANAEDTVAVSLTVTEAPVIALSGDSLAVTLAPGQIDSTVLTIANNGASPLEFSIADEDILGDGARTVIRKRYPSHYYGLELEKGDADPRRGTPAVEGAGGPDAFGYRWIDSNEPGG